MAKIGQSIMMSECPIGHYMDDGWALYEVVRSGDVLQQSFAPDNPCLKVYKLFDHTKAREKERGKKYPQQEGQIISNFFKDPKMVYAGEKETADRLYQLSNEAFEKSINSK